MTRDRVGRLIEAWLDVIPRGAVFAEIDCKLSTYTVRRPDLSVFLGERANAFDLNRIPVPFAPDIAIEVLSPSESAIDVNRKALEYLAGGSREVWLLDHLNCEVFVQTASAIQLFRGTDLVESKLLPGFAPAVKELLGSPRASRLTPALA